MYCWQQKIHLKIIDQIYYFRYALMQKFKGTRKIAIKVASEVHRQSFKPIYMKVKHFSMKSGLTDVDRPYLKTSSTYFPLLSTTTGSELRGILLKFDKLELHSSKLGAI